MIENLVSAVIILFLVAAFLFNIASNDKYRSKQYSKLDDLITDKYNTIRFLIQYQCSVRILDVTIKHFNQSNEWITEHLRNPEYEYMVEMNRDVYVVSIIYERTKYYVGEVPLSFPIEIFNDSGINTIIVPPTKSINPS